ncbi:MAG: helix-turn-helix domain-containing protein [Eubacteriales bacterium]|nr:helix-turn-helix domain-containing protein [Eubacteriales bacterium]
MFSQNLLTVLNGLSLTIPPLRDCPEDLEHIWQERTKKYLEKHHRFLTITEGGREWFLSQKWPGHFLQLDRFCERLVLSAPRKSVDERLLSSLYRKSEFPDEPPVIPAPSPVYIPPEAAEIAEALKNNLGNRRATAQALGISTSTLWRKMNKYNIDL